MLTLKEILDQNNNDVDFPLFESTFTISSQRIIYRQISLKYNSVANIVRDDFKKLLSEIRNIDELLSSLPEAFSIAMEKGMEEISKDAISIGDYSLDSNTIINLCNKEKHFEPFVKAYKQYQEYNNAILSNLSNASAIRERNKNSRARWTSTTIGGNMLDAWSNQLKASTMNAFEGAGHSLMNAISDVIDESNADDERKALFNNTSYRNTLINGVWESANNLRMIVTNVISKRNNIPLGGWVTNNDSSEAEGLYNNVIKFDMPGEKKQEIIHKILSLDPFNAKYYIGALNLYLENGKEILDIANFLNINGIMNETSSILSNYTLSHLGTTEDDLVECRKLLQRVASELSINDDFLKNSNAIITTQGVNILTKYINSNIGTSEEDANNCMNKARELQKKMNLKDDEVKDVFKIITKRLEVIDIQCRTVDGVILPTREVAEKSKKDIRTYEKSLHLRSEYKMKHEFLEHINEINSLPIENALKTKYISEISKKKSEFEKKCKKAARHQYRLDNNGNIFWNGDVLNMIIEYGILLYVLIANLKIVIIDKDFSTLPVGCILIGFISLLIFRIFPSNEAKIWNSLTQEGKYTLTEITSENISASTNVKLDKPH